MNDAALAAVHRIEAERLARRLYFIGRDLRGHAKLFDAQRPIIVGIECNARMIVGVHAQSFLGDVFESQKKLGAIAQDEVDIVAMKLDDQIRGFEVRVALIAGLE